MNKVSLNSKVSLLEIVLSLLIFATAGIIMLNCFGVAKFTQIRANDKAIAGAIIQSDFEIIKSLSSIEELHEFLNSYEIRELKNTFTYTKYYDENWEQGNGKEYAVTIVIEHEILKSGELININIFADKEKPYPFTNKGGQQIYSIESKKFFPFLGGAYE
ncbi:MAG: hypothetical protein GX289_04060 [Tissierellia bacterium]|jgi:hypothetical protein|nr:hypothetical protein [Tissierellia bacterium]